MRGRAKPTTKHVGRTRKLAENKDYLAVLSAFSIDRAKLRLNLTFTYILAIS